MLSLRYKGHSLFQWLWCFWADFPIFSQQATSLIHQRCVLANQWLDNLLLHSLYCHKAHLGSIGWFCNRQCIIFTAHYKRLDRKRRNRFDLMPQLLNAPTPRIRTITRLHHNQCRLVLPKLHHQVHSLHFFITDNLGQEHKFEKYSLINQYQLRYISW